MVRLAVWLTIACATGAACAPSHVPVAKTFGKWTALAGVTGLIATATLGRYIDGSQRDFGLAFAAVSGVGIVTYALGELSQPPDGGSQETLSERHTRWAHILTERAEGAAREGNCPRVQRLEHRVRAYDVMVHDMVFMRDPEIQKCLALPPPDPSTPADVPQTPEEIAPLSSPSP
jgi:hypothetical protein